MIVSPPSRLADTVKVRLNGELLDTVNNYNYLGVIIDDKLTFESFLKAKCNKVNVRIYQLGKLRKFITSKIASTIYKQTILPLIEYADLIIDSGPLDKVSRLQKLQDKAIHLIDDGRHGLLDIEVVSNLYRITPLKLRRAEHLSLVMFRLKSDPLRIEQQRPNVHLRGRNKIKFKKYNRQNEKYLRSIFHRGVTMWDRIPEQIQRLLQRLSLSVKLNHT